MSDSYIKVAELSQIKPGKMLRVNIDSLQLLLANVDGVVYAVDDMCSHEDASLYNGALKGDCVECPLHGSHFDLRTGLPKEPPATEAINTYPVKIENQAIYVQLQQVEANSG